MCIARATMAHRSHRGHRCVRAKCTCIHCSVPIGVRCALCAMNRRIWSRSLAPLPFHLHPFAIRSLEPNQQPFGSFSFLSVARARTRARMYVCWFSLLISCVCTTTRRSGNIGAAVAGILCHFETAVEGDSNGQKNVRISTIVGRGICVCAFFCRSISKPMEQATKKSSTEHTRTHQRIMRRLLWSLLPTTGSSSNNNNKNSD